MRYPASEKLEIINLVERSHLPAKQTLDMLGVPRPTFYRWYDRYLEHGEDGLVDRAPMPRLVWNRIPDNIRCELLDMALDETELSPRELAVRFTDTKGYFVSESSVYRLLKAHDLISSPAFIGTAGSLDISGTLAVGASIGTLTTTGDVVFRIGSDFQVELAADGTNDLLSVGGAATIEGGTLSIFTLDPDTVYTDGQSYTVLTAAGGMSGQFSQLVETSAFLDFTADYQANDLVITLETVLTFPDVANTFNQTQASTGLMELGQTVGSDSLAVYNALLILDANSARGAFDLSSGEIYAGIVASDQRQARAQSDKLVSQAWRGGKDGLGAWGSVSVQDGSVDLDGNGGDLDFDRQSIDLGIDYRGGDNTWVAGVSAGWSEGDVTLAARNSAAKTDSWQMGAYGRVGTGREGLSAGGAISLSKGNADVARNIRFAGINRTATSSTDTDTTSLAAQARYGKQIGSSNWVVGPVASVSYASTDLDEFAETGADALNLAGTAKSDASVYGAGLFANWQGDKGFLDASVQYGTGDLGRAQASLRLDGASNTPFLVRAAEHDNDRAIFKVQGALNLGNDWSLAANARAE